MLPQHWGILSIRVYREGLHSLLYRMVNILLIHGTHSSSDLLICYVSVVHIYLYSTFL